MSLRAKPEVCSLDDCENKIHRSSLCRKHYDQRRRGARNKSKACVSAEGCLSTKILRNGLCAKHYRQKHCSKHQQPCVWGGEGVEEENLFCAKDGCFYPPYDHNLCLQHLDELSLSPSSCSSSLCSSPDSDRFSSIFGYEIWVNSPLSFISNSQDDDTE